MHTGPHNRRHMVLRSWTVVLDADGGLLAEDDPAKTCARFPIFRYFTLQMLFEYLSDICAASDKPIILIIDEVDSATNNQVFLDFLAQLRAYYIQRIVQPTFQSVILAGVYDIKNLKLKLRPEGERGVNSPWNIAIPFKIDMSFSKDGIAGMLREYETDYHTGMNIDEMSDRKSVV